jgi:TorA maturation chaperone TorD
VKAAAQSEGRALRDESRRWLETAARWRVLSLLFQLPTRESRRELNRLVEGLPGELAAAAREWTRFPLKDAEAEYHRVFGSGGIPATESAYDPNALAGRGPLLADIAGFHEAFAYRPERPPAPVPDHIAAEADFLSYLALKVAFALDAENDEEGQIAVRAFERFLSDHLRAWLPAFQERAERAGLPWLVRVLPALTEAASHSGGRAASRDGAKRS